jgi:hypothetical protein
MTPPEKRLKIVRLEQLALNKFVINMEDTNLEKIDLEQKLESQAENLEVKSSEVKKVPESELVEKFKTTSSPESEKKAELNKIEVEKSDKILAPEKKVIEDVGLSAQSSVIAIQKRREEAIDKILADGLGDIFLKMSPAKQKEFQAKGEETTKKIALLLKETKVRVSKIVELIKKWLKLIPGVNKFFLEQETKLKVDKIIKMKNNF